MPAGEKEASAWKHFVAGNVGGVFGLSLCYPLDTVKVRMQTRPRGTYRGIVHCVTTMARAEGILSLYRGLLSPVVGYGAIKAMAFGSYNKLKHVVADSYRWRSTSGRQGVASLTLDELAACGAGAGFVQSFVRAPVEQVKVLMQARNAKSSSTLPPYRGSWHCLVETVKAEGIATGLYRALPATFVREMPQYAIYYPTYEVFKKLFIKEGNNDNSRWGWMMLAGGLAGVAQWVPTYSFDVVKSRIHAAEPGTYKSLLHCTKVLYAQEGFGVFFRGFSACIARAFPLHGVVFVGYEITMKLIA